MAGQSEDIAFFGGGARSLDKILYLKFVVFIADYVSFVNELLTKQISTLSTIFIIFGL